MRFGSKRIALAVFSAFVALGGGAAGPSAREAEASESAMSDGPRRFRERHASAPFLRVGQLMVALLILTAVVSTSLALADEGGQTETGGDRSAEMSAATESTVAVEPTDPEAAESLPLEDLNREEAGEVLEGVFEPELDGPAGIFDDLHVEKFLAPNVAVIAAGEQPALSTEEEARGSLVGSEDPGATLLDSTVPLATEGESGRLEAVDLNLERSEGSLAPANSLLEVSIPAELGEGIEVPGPGVRIEPEGIDGSRGSSIVGEGVAFYPNVAEEVDLAVAPTFDGVETMSQLRSPESPRTETFRLALPPGASLRAEGGGAVVKRGEATLMSVAPPTALDAEGNPVPTELEVEGDRITITTSPTFTTTYPVLVDPLFQSFEWYAKNAAPEIESNLNEGWSWKNGSVWCSSSTEDYMDSFVPSYSRGLVERGWARGGSWEGFCQYAVPRWGSEPEGRKPETFISRMTASDVAWRAESPRLNPYLYMGLWGPGHGWASLYTHEGLMGHSINNLSYVYSFPNETNSPEVKFAEVGMISNEPGQPEGPLATPLAEVFVGAATIELSEPAASAPTIGTLYGPTGWLRSGTAVVHFTAADLGLGMQTVTVGAPEGYAPKTWKTSKGCIGVAYSPCPSSWSGEVAVEPEGLPSGVDRLPVTFEDPLGHSTVGHIEVGVDHQAPQVTLSGSMTEQAKLGTALPAYTINASAIDGVEKYPQSGVAKMTIKIDGTVVDESAPGCATEDCPLSREWTLSSEKYAPGPHSVEVTAVDAVGNSTTKTLWIQLRPTSPPIVSVSGSLTEQSALGTNRPRYSLTATSSTAEQPETSAKTPPAFVSSFGSIGTGNGQFKTAGGVAIGPNGRLIVADPTDGRIEAFNPQGEYLFQFGTSGSGEGQLSSSAWNLAVDPSGDVWVADTGNNRVEEFSEAGKLIRQFGSKGSAAGQFNSPECIAFDRNGDVWVSDRLNNRLEKFSAKGEYISSLALSAVSSLAITPAGELWVVQGEMVNVYSETGVLEKKPGRGPSPVTELRGPFAVTVDPAGHVWLADRSGKVFEFGQAGPYGTYIGKFGAPGAGAGQFAFSAKATEIAADGSGFLWVSDPGNDRVQKWEVGLAPGSNATEVLMDGKKVGSTITNCMNEACRAVTNWTLESSAYAPGAHTVTVKTTDGDGRSATETLPIEIRPDKTAPAIEVGGELANAPEGWVQQETYGVHASATDGGDGVTSLILKIDGRTVASESASCLDGGCGLSLSSQVDLAPYSGGSHKAEFIATDGAGNRNVKSWTINVDPEGRITTQEEAETLEAVETTSEQGPVVTTDQLLEPEQREDGDDPGLKLSGSEITSTGVPDVTTMTTDPQDGFLIESPEGTTRITPVVSEESSSLSVQNGVAGTTANVAKEVDSVIRPEYNGVQIAQAIRSESSPESFSWVVHLAPRQELTQVNSSQAEVVYADGTEAFLITAEPSHDATGKPVPTSIDVSGDEMTVRVEFHGGTFVYPIVAGEGWETSYEAPVIVQGPEDETQIREREERERREAEELAAAEGEGEGGPTPAPPGSITPAEAERVVEGNMQSGGITVAPPESACSGKCATASAVRTFVVDERHDCSELGCGVWHVNLATGDEAERPHFLRGYRYSEWVNGTGVKCSYHYGTVWAATGLSVTEEGCGFAGPWRVFKKEDKHLTVWMRDRIEEPYVSDLYQGFKEDWLAVQDWAWPNGYQQRVVKHYDPAISEG
jgi:hypothetical protein